MGRCAIQVDQVCKQATVIKEADISQYPEGSLARKVQQNWRPSVRKREHPWTQNEGKRTHPSLGKSGMV